MEREREGGRETVSSNKIKYIRSVEVATESTQKQLSPACMSSVTLSL